MLVKGGPDEKLHDSHPWTSASMGPVPTTFPESWVPCSSTRNITSDGSSLRNATLMLFACSYWLHFSFEKIMLILLIDTRFKSTLTHFKLDKLQVKTSSFFWFQCKTVSPAPPVPRSHTGTGEWLQMALQMFFRAFVRNSFRRQSYWSHFQVTFTCYKYKFDRYHSEPDS